MFPISTSFIKTFRSRCSCFVRLQTIFFSAQCQRSLNVEVLRDAHSKWTLEYSTVQHYIVHLSGIHQFVALFTPLRIVSEPEMNAAPSSIREE